MPYIKKETRELYNPEIEILAKKIIEDSELEAKNWKGDLNYICFKLAKSMEQHLQEHYKFSFGYQDHSDVISAFRDCADEYSRRVLAPYEDKKIKENGDV
jgi:hypothetical protein